MKLWLDDLRHPPDDTWHWCTTIYCARGMLLLYPISEMSLDNDLGEGQEEGRRLVLWMCDTSTWPSGEITIHSANPVAGEYMRSMIDRYRPQNARGPRR